MTDPRNVAHDKKVENDKKHHHEETAGHPATGTQPGKKTPQIDADTAPSNSVAHELYKQGEEPRVHHDADHHDSEKGNSDADGKSAGQG